MFRSNITGTWKGAYTYGKAYGKLAGHSVGFTMELKDDEGIITGTCTDDDAKDLFNGPVTIKGVFSGKVISFKKTYPQEYYIDEEGNRYVSDMPGDPVEYNGSLRQLWIFGKRFFKGKWTIARIVVDENGIEVRGVGRGTWRMDRVD